MISEVFNCDCMEGMKKYPDKYFDLAVVDPPYGINAANMQMGSAPNRKENEQYPGESIAVKLKKNRLQRLNSGGGKLKNRLLNTSKIEWDYEKPSIEYFNELKRVSKNQIIWGGNYFNLQATRCIICWDKIQSWNNFSQWEMAWTSFDKPAAMYRFSNTGGANLEKKIHPTQKPIQLYEWIYKNYLPNGGKVIDTHLGSGSNRIAAEKMGNIDFIGYEIDKEYFDAQEQRFKIHIAQKRLF